MAKEIDFDNLTQEQYDSWIKVEVEQELVDKFIEIYKTKKHNRAYLEQCYGIYNTQAGKILRSKRAFNSIIRVKKSILDYVKSDHADFEEFQEKRRKATALKRKLARKKNIETRTTNSEIEKMIDEGRFEKYDPPIKLEIGKSYKITTKFDTVEPQKVLKVKIINEYPRLYEAIDSHNNTCCVNKNDLFLASIKVQEIKEI